MLYEEYIANILSNRGRFNCGSEYHERHHIIPKCCGGSDNEENLIDLFAREHFIAHKLLAEENPANHSLQVAYAAMAFMHNGCEARYILHPEEYEVVRKSFSASLKNRYKDITQHPSYGKHISQRRKSIISQANKGNKYCLGRKYSRATIQKMRDSHKNISDETRSKMSIAQKNRNLSFDNNPRSKKVIRLSDGVVFGSIKSAALAASQKYTTFKSNLNKGTLSDYQYCD